MPTPIGTPTIISETSAAGVWTVKGQKRFMYRWHDYTQTILRFSTGATGRIAADGGFWQVETRLDKKSSPARPPSGDYFTTLPEELDEVLSEAILRAVL